MKNIYRKILFLVLVAFCLVCYFFYPRTESRPDISDGNIEALIRQIARWTVASQQDTSPMISLLHANYAAGYLQALELVATEKQINIFQDLQTLRKKVYGAQDTAIQKVISACPNYTGTDIDKELALIGVGTHKSIKD
jgi:hypothetical protein